MKNTSHTCFCPLKGLIKPISKKWSLFIVNEIGNHDRLYYSELSKILRGISPKSLADALHELERYGLVLRKKYGGQPARVEYMLTPAGKELRRAATPLIQFAAKYEPSNVKTCACCDTIAREF